LRAGDGDVAWNATVHHINPPAAALQDIAEAKAMLAKKGFK